MSDLVIATTNPGKVREIRLALAGAAVTLRTLEDFPAVDEPEETGQTFAENAALKARYYFAATGVTTVAEDSGLVIDALDGRPGIYSARYPGATYVDKFANLYRELAPHPRPWIARFVCALAVVGQDGSALGARRSALDKAASLPGRPAEPELQAPNSSAERRVPSAVLFTASAFVEGEIAPEPRGAHGFGYDPILFYPPFQCTLGESTDAQKLSVSHRGQAFAKLGAWLAQFPSDHQTSQPARR